MQGETGSKEKLSTSWNILAQDQNETALAEFNQAITSDPTHYETYYSKALVCEKLGKSREASEAYRNFVGKSNFY